MTLPIQGTPTSLGYLGEPVVFDDCDQFDRRACQLRRSLLQFLKNGFALFRGDALQIDIQLRHVGYRGIEGRYDEIGNALGMPDPRNSR